MENNARLRFRASALVLTIATVLLGITVALPRSANAMTKMTKREASLLHTTNHIRAHQKLRPLRSSASLQRAAVAKARDMFRNQYFAHSRPGRGPWSWVGSDRAHFRSLGENIALGGFSNSTIVTGLWLGSTGHRHNLLNPRYTHVGVAVVSGRLHGRLTTVVVEVYGGMVPRAVA